MASVRPEDFLETVYQIRFHDDRRDPPCTTNSLPKPDYTYAEAQEEAQWRQQLYDRGEFDPWTQERPGELVQEEHVTVGEAIERYVRCPRIRGDRPGEDGGSSLNRRSASAPFVCRRTHLPFVCSVSYIEPGRCSPSSHLFHTNPQFP